MMIFDFWFSMFGNSVWFMCMVGIRFRLSLVN